jgi:mannose-6-phosphate isomerase-like protein (cupin superfamily)
MLSLSTAADDGHAQPTSQPGGLVNEKVNLADKLGLFDEYWQPKIVAGFNANEVRIVKVKGEFVWHKHDDTDDFFLVLEGHLTIQLRDRNVQLDEGELFVVPRGVEHCPRADEEAAVLLIEHVGTINTGDAGGPLTAKPQPI